MKLLKVTMVLSRSGKKHFTVKPVKTTTIGTSEKWSPWTGGHLIKHLYKTPL